MAVKYFNLEIQIKDDVATSAIYARSSQEDAITNFHTSMSSMRTAVDAGTIDEATGLVINSEGSVDQNHCERYAKPVPAPAPEE